MQSLSIHRSRALWLPLLLLFALNSGCADSNQRAANLAAQAQSQFQAGDLENARSSIGQAIATRDDVADYYVLLGRIELQAERPTSAFNAYSLALDLQADNPEVLQAIAELGLQTGRLHEADEAADRMLLLMPNAVQAMLVKGFIAIDDGRIRDAWKMANDILALNPNDEGGIILSARLRALEGQQDEALSILDAASGEVRDTNAMNLTRLEIYRLQGDAARMKEILPRILKNMTGDSDYTLDYVNLLYKTGEAVKARQESVKAIEGAPKDLELLSKLSDLWVEHDRLPLSNAQIRFFAESGTRGQQLVLARFYFESGELAKARQLLSRLSDQRVLEAQALMARINLAEGDKVAAYRQASAILLADARNGDALLVNAARNLAEGKIDRAIEDLNIVVADSPQNLDGYIALANAYSAKGTEIRARQTFERGMDALPQSLRLAEAFRAYLLKTGDKSRIVSLEQDVAVAKPSSVRAWSIYAQTCRQLGDALCSARADAGLTVAKRSYLVDDPPGTPRRRGLFARITPEKICASTGGICTRA